MRMVPILFFAVPIIMLLVGWIFGRARIARAIVFYAVWIFGCEALAFVSLVEFPLDPRALIGVIASCILALLGAWLAVAFSVWTSKPVSPAPGAVIAKAAIDGGRTTYGLYQGLNEEDQRRVRSAGRMGVKLGLSGFADYLRRTGRPSAAHALRAGSRIL
ncbi:MAG TPA: hypothetical protein VHD55_02995 [Candidatus Paceibacterota bacterium]|nr:hypothetical protein [Candidatus Paceibacterota bacterium]